LCSFDFSLTVRCERPVLQFDERWIVHRGDSTIARPRAEPGAGPITFDTGLTDLMTTLQYKDGQAIYCSVDNPRWLKSKLTQIVELQRMVSALEGAAKTSSGKAKDFPVDTRLRAAYNRLRSTHRKVRNQREDFYHKLSAWMVSTFGHIITEKLSVDTMLTDQTKGAGLKRSITDAAWATGLLAKLRTKAEEAGSKFEEIPTRLIKPTRRCSCCGAVTSKKEMPLSQRTCVCASCGFTLPRDRNACRNMVRFSFEGAWWSGVIANGPRTGPETPSEKALAPAQVE
jgi:putative transposase